MESASVENTFYTQLEAVKDHIQSIENTFYRERAHSTHTERTHSTHRENTFYTHLEGFPRSKAPSATALFFWLKPHVVICESPTKTAPITTIDSFLNIFS